MIKYSHKGLIKDGKLPFLFYLQYLLITVVFYSQYLLTFTLSKNKNLKNLRKTMLSTFKSEEVKVIPIVHYFSTLICIYFMLLVIMVIGMFYSKRKSSKHHYRQNVFTFNSTLLWGLIHFGLFISLYLTLTREAFKKFKIRCMAPELTSPQLMTSSQLKSPQLKSSQFF